MKTVAAVLAEALVEAGVEVVFGLPGGENTDVLDAMRRYGMAFVLVHNENSAVFMAAANPRLTGRPGVCLTTLGPGTANACAGVAHAYLDRTPVLVITAQSIGHLIGKHIHQVIDLQALFAPITKFSGELTVQGTRSTVRDALALTMHGRPGPVHLGVSSEQAGSEIDAFDDLPGRRSPLNTVSDQPSGKVSGIDAAFSLLAKAARPLIIAGLGLEPEGPYAELRTLADALHAPVIVTPKAKGALADDHPLSAGTIGLTRTDPVYAVLDEADLIVAVGFDVVELVKSWGHLAPLIWVAPWTNDDPQIAASVEFLGAMGPVLRQLSGGSRPVNPEWGAARVGELHAEMRRRTLPSPKSGTMRPQSVLAAIRASIPREALITTDVGSHKILTALTWPAYEPNRYLVSNGLSAMGYGLAAAIAAAQALGEPVVAITGDAGFVMVMGELGLIRRLNLPVIVVVMNDSALDLIRSAQVRSGKPPHGVEFLNPDFASIAAAYAIDFYRVATRDEATRAMRTAFTNQRPALIEALIDPVSYPTTPPE